MPINFKSIHKWTHKELPDEEIDDFESLLDSSSLQVIIVILFVIILTFNNFHIIAIANFEKYGG